MKKNLLGIFSILIFAGGSLFAQTAEERAAIVSTYDLQKLSQLENELSQKFTGEQQKAFNLAAIKGWPLEIELANGGNALLIGVFEDGTPKYYETDNREGGITTRTDRVHTGGSAGLDLNGENMVAGIWDGGRVRSTHVMLENRATQIDNTSALSTHSTHVAGTMIGSKVAFGGTAVGMAPLAVLEAYNFNNDEPEMAAAAATGLLISNHSYGIPAVSSQGVPVPLYYLGYYDDNARQLDQITYNAPYYLPVCSAGNDRQSGGNTGDGGFDYLTDKSVAKNNIVCAAVFEVLDYTSPSSVVMSSFSSWGPTDDGRIKPDLSAKGVSMLSSSSTTDNARATLSGTSMATPNISGSLVLLQQHYNELNGNFMTSATLRGLALHTADEAGSTPGPDYRFGWGLMNTERAAAVITNNNVSSLIIEENLLENEVYTFTVQADGVNPLMASITWTDPAGNLLPINQVDLSTPSLVNDLDIRVSQDGGDTFFPWKLNPAVPAASATQGDNIVDNIEKIEIPSASGEYIIRVSHKNTLVNSGQAFSLILTGIAREDFNVSSHQGLKEVCGLDSSETFDLDLAFNDGNTDTVDFTVEGNPSGTTVSLSTTSLAVAGSTTLTISGIDGLSPGDYSIKVIATGSTQTVNTYVILKITDTNFAAVIPSLPTDNAIEQALNLDFTWEEGDSFTTLYDFELALENTFTTIVSSQSVQSNEATVSGLLNDTEYFWRVRATNDCADGPYSETFSFTTEESLGINDFTQTGLKLYPNPVTSILNIENNQPIEKVEILNILGQTLLTDTSSENKIALNISSLRVGNYFVRVTTDGSVSTHQILKK